MIIVTTIDAINKKSIIKTNTRHQKQKVNNHNYYQAS